MCIKIVYIAHNLLKNICSRFTQNVITDEKNSDEILCMLKETYKKFCDDTEV